MRRDGRQGGTVKLKGRVGELAGILTSVMMIINDWVKNNIGIGVCIVRK
jgi:hypothetical protein